jgi:hypothetical protein
VGKVLQLAIGNVGKEILDDRCVIALGDGDDRIEHARQIRVFTGHRFDNAGADVGAQLMINQQPGHPHETILRARFDCCQCEACMGRCDHSAGQYGDDGANQCVAP